MGIRLHPKHGVNPTIPTCFWCGKDRNEVALLGAAYKGEAPMHMVLDYEPCDACKEKMAGGITVIEASQAPVLAKHQPSLFGAYPTGRWFIATADWAHRVITPPDLLAQVLHNRKCLMDTETFGAIVKANPEAFEQ